jgi:hypothetical protein
VALTEIQMLLLQQLRDKPLRRIVSVPQFCLDLEADGYVEITAPGQPGVSVEITKKGHEALSSLGTSADIIRLDKVNANEDDKVMRRRGGFL